MLKEIEKILPDIAFNNGKYQGSHQKEKCNIEIKMTFDLIRDKYCNNKKHPQRSEYKIDYFIKLRHKKNPLKLFYDRLLYNTL